MQGLNKQYLDKFDVEFVCICTEPLYLSETCSNMLFGHNQQGYLYMQSRAFDDWNDYHSVVTVKDVRSLYPMRGISDATIDYVRYRYYFNYVTVYLWKIILSNLIHDLTRVCKT